MFLHAAPCGRLISIVMRLLASSLVVLLLTACQSSDLARYYMKSCAYGVTKWSELDKPPPLREELLQISGRLGTLEAMLEVNDPNRLEKWYVDEEGNYLVCTFVNTPLLCLQSTLTTEFHQDGESWTNLDVLEDVCFGDQ